MRKTILYSLLLLLSLSSETMFAQSLTYVIDKLPNCHGSLGAIKLRGNITASTNYRVSYNRMGYPSDTVQLTSDAERVLTIPALQPGIYTKIVISAGNTNSAMPGFIELNDSCQRYITPASYNPTCGGNNGELTISGLSANTRYTVTYHRDSVKHSKDASTDGEGTLTLHHLPSGTYTQMRVAKINMEKDTFKYVFPVILVNNNSKCLAVQSTVFSGAAYENFTDIQDDNPTGFTQFYARLNQPLNKAGGIPRESGSRERLIPLRNFMFQLTYGNTDNFKMYTTNFFDKKYVNRLDLLGHAYFHGSMHLNMLTYVIPQYWQTHKGEMGHLYLDAIIALLVTNVTDTGNAINKTSPAKTYNIKSDVFGLSLKSRFNNVFNSNFYIEAGAKLFWIFPQSAPINASLAPQNADVNAYSPSIFNYNTRSDSDALNSFLTTGKNVAPYYAFEVLIQYNTSANAENNSNIFLHYNYANNMTGNRAAAFPNSYWQFQIGYNLDITKVFSQKPAANANAKSDAPELPVNIPAATTASTTATNSAAGTTTATTQQTTTTTVATSATKVVDTTATVVTKANLKMHKEANLASPSTTTEKAGSKIKINAYTEGEKYQDNSKWYRSTNNLWFWSGLVKPDGK